MNKNCTLLILFFLLIQGFVTAQSTTPPELDHLLDEMEISSRELRHLVSRSENRTHRLAIWVNEAHSPQKSMRVGVLETELRKQFVWMVACGTEISSLSQKVSALDSRISGDFFVQMKAETKSVKKALGVRLTAMVSAVNSEDTKATALLQKEMAQYLNQLTQRSKSLDLQLDRIRRNLLHS